MKNLKKGWKRYVKLYNGFVIQSFLILIWFLILSPTALLKKAFQKIFFSSSHSNKNKSFFKKSDKIEPDHFLRPF